MYRQNTELSSTFMKNLEVDESSVGRNSVVDETPRIFLKTNAQVRTPSQFHFKPFLIDGWEHIEKKFSKSNEPFLSYLPTTTGHSAHLGRLAGAAQLVTQKGLVRFSKFLFHRVPTINYEWFEVKLGWCSDLSIDLKRYQVCTEAGFLQI